MGVRSEHEGSAGSEYARARLAFGINNAVCRSISTPEKSPLALLPLTGFQSLPLNEAHRGQVVQRRHRDRGTLCDSCYWFACFHWLASAVVGRDIVCAPTEMRTAS